MLGFGATAMSWAERAATNLLPLSREQRDLAAALREWRYTGDFNDLEAPIETCQLCDHPDIRYQFEIRNLQTGGTLLIGSECINRFGIAATDEEGHTLGRDESRKKVSRDRRSLIEEARRKRVVSALVALANADQEFNILSFIDYLQTRGAFTPKQLSTLMWRMDKHSISYNPSDFKLTIKRNREKDQLTDMPDWELRRVEPCLSPVQRKYLADFREAVKKGF